MTQNLARNKIVTVFLFLVMILNLAGFFVREYLIATHPEEETRWIEYMFAGAHLAVAVCAFMIWRGRKTALYLLLTITLFVIITDLSLTQFAPNHHASIPDIILAFGESVILLILLRPWKKGL